MRTRKVSSERVPGPAAVPVVVGTYGTPVAAPDIVVDVKLGIHLAYYEVSGSQGGEVVDLAKLRLLCGDEHPGSAREQIAAPLDHPAFCPVCRKARPHSVGSLVRVVTIAVIRP